MAFFFFKIDLNFSLKENDENNCMSKYNPDDDYVIQILVRSKKESDVNIGFDIGNNNCDSGQLTHQKNKDLIEISCKGIFKVNVKDHYEKDVLDDKALWLFESFGVYEQGLKGLKINDGLEAEEYTYRRRGEEVKGFRYPLKIETSSIKKNLE